jgi:hypothetical protein
MSTTPRLSPRIANIVNQIDHHASSVSQIDHHASSVSQIDHHATSVSQIDHHASSVSQINHLYRLPNEVLSIVFTNLRKRDIVNVVETSKRCNQIVSTTHFYKKFLECFSPSPTDVYAELVRLCQHNLVDKMKFFLHWDICISHFMQRNRDGKFWRTFFYGLDVVDDMCEEYISNAKGVSHPNWGITKKEVFVQLPIAYTVEFGDDEGCWGRMGIDTRMLQRGPFVGHSVCLHMLYRVYLQMGWRRAAALEDISKVRSVEYMETYADVCMKLCMKWLVEQQGVE